jgi:hypothetical protein
VEVVFQAAVGAVPLNGGGDILQALTDLASQVDDDSGKILPPDMMP